MPTTEEEIKAHIAAVEKRAQMGYIGADSIDFFHDDAPNLVTVEVNGVVVDGLTGHHSGEIVLNEESAGYAIWALAKSIGLPDKAEAMLKAAKVKGFA